MDVAVGLVESYLRANGYLTVTELQVEREQGGRFEAATDLDILAIRLPWAAEVVARRPGAPDRVLLQDPALDVSRTGSDVLIGEVRVSPPHGLDCRIRLASFAGYVEDPPAFASCRSRWLTSSSSSPEGSVKTEKSCGASRSTIRCWHPCGCWTNSASTSAVPAVRSST